MKFDYKILEEQNSILGGGKKDLEKSLKAAGLQGWDAVGVTMTNGIYTVLLKKEID